MQKLATGNDSPTPSARTQAGLSLIETLVVLVIASVLATMVTLRLGDLGPVDELIESAEKVAVVINESCERAMLQSEVMLFSFSSTGLYQMGLPQFGRSPNETSPLVSNLSSQDRQASPPQKRVNWPSEVQISVEVEGHAVVIDETLPRSDAPVHIICGSLGERTAFVLTLRQAGESVRLQMPAFGDWVIERV